MAEAYALSPYALALGIEPGDPLRMPYTDALLGRPGFVHGGAIAGLLDVAMQLAFARALGTAAVGTSPVTATVEFVRGALLVETFASATVERIGRRLANLSAVAWQSDRARPIAMARATMLVERAPD